MSIDVRFFASLSERLGKTSASVDAANVTTAADVWRQAVGSSDADDTSAADELDGNALGERVLIAINQEYAKADAPVVDGDEVAFFPPVTGG